MNEKNERRYRMSERTVEFLLGLIAFALLAVLGAFGFHIAIRAAEVASRVGYKIECKFLGCEEIKK